MTALKIHHLLTLAHLLSLGCRGCPVPVTTSVLGEAANISQQAASSHLADLEAGGMIRRVAGGRGHSVVVTAKGYAEVARISAIFRAALERESRRMVLRGTVVSGVGEGAYYMSLPGYTKQFEKEIGLVPFPGTLNVKLDAASARSILDLDMLGGVLIRGFSDGRRTYGWARCYGAVLEQDIPCHMIRLERTHHDTSIMELISATNLREQAGISDGSQVSVALG